MILKITYLKASLLLLFFCLSLFSFAQIENDDKKALQGEWVLDEISFFEVKGTARMKVDYINSDIFTELKIEQDAISFVYNELNQKEKCVVNDDSLSFNLFSQPISITWKIVENKLYLQQEVIDTLDKSRKAIITSAYKRK